MNTVLLLFFLLLNFLVVLFIYLFILRLYVFVQFVLRVALQRRDHVVVKI